MSYTYQRSLLLLLTLNFIVSAQSGKDAGRPCPKPVAYTLRETERYDEPAAPRGTYRSKPHVGPGVSFKCLGVTSIFSFVNGEFSDGKVEWLTLSDVVFQDPRIFFSTGDKKITGFMAGVIHFPFDYVPTLEFLYFAKAMLNGVLLREFRLPVESVTRVVIRSRDFDVETDTQKYTVITEDPVYDAASQPRLLMENGKSVYVGRLP